MFSLALSKEIVVEKGDDVTVTSRLNGDSDHRCTRKEIRKELKRLKLETTILRN